MLLWHIWLGIGFCSLMFCNTSDCVLLTCIKKFYLDTLVSLSISDQVCYCCHKSFLYLNTWANYNLKSNCYYYCVFLLCRCFSLSHRTLLFQIHCIYSTVHTVKMSSTTRTTVKGGKNTKGEHKTKTDTGKLLKLLLFFFIYFMTITYILQLRNFTHLMVCSLF